MVKNADWGPEDKTIKASERMESLVGKKVKVIMSYAMPGQMVGTEFEAIYKDCFPLGKEYFLKFDFNGAERLVRTLSTVEILEIK